MTIIKCAEIPYLKEEVLEKYKNAIVVSAEGMIIKMNSLMLCAISQSIKMALNEDYDDHTIITEFSLEELKQLKAYYIRGVCETISESMIKSFGLKEIDKRNTNAINQKQSSDDNFTDNKIKKSQVVLKTPDPKSEIGEILENSLSNSTDIIPMVNTAVADEDIKNESVDQNVHHIKDEVIEDDKEFDFNLEYFSDDSCDNPTEEEITDIITKNKVERKKKASEADIDWEPEKLKNARLFNKELSKKDLEMLKTFELPKSLESYKRKPNNLKNLKNRIEESKNDETKPFQCSQCLLRVSHEIYLKSHIIKHHFEHLPCTFCHNAYHLEDVEEFKKHMFIHINLSKNAEKIDSFLKGCIQCGKDGRKDAMSLHFKQLGPLHNDECSQCSKKMGSFREYQNHVNDQHYGVWKYKCGYCPLIFDERKECWKHTRDAHRQHEFKLRPKKEKRAKSKTEKIETVCHLCGSNTKNIQQHMSYNHTQSGPYPCSQCDQICDTQAKLKGHMGNVHLKKPCYQCGEMVKSKKMYHHILQKHTADHEKPYQCQNCG